MSAITLAVQETICAPIQKVFDFIVDPFQLPKAMSSLIENTNVSDIPLKEGSTYNYKYKMFGVTLDGVWEVKEMDSPKIYSARTVGAIDSEWAYELQEEGEVTRITLTITYKPPQSVIEQLKLTALSAANEVEAKNFLHNLKVLTE